MLVNRSHVASLGIAMFMACAIPALAQDVQDLLSVEGETDAASEATPPHEVDPSTGELLEIQVANQYRIGLDCAPSSATLQSHLHLDGDTGLTVNMVLPNSPAAIAGIRQHDVIVEANGRAVGEVQDLVQQVNASKETEMSITLIREATEHLVKLTPEKRDEDELQRLRNGFRGQLEQNLPGFEAADLEEMFKQFPQLNQFGNGAIRRINPGFAIPSLPDIPNDFNLRIERNDDRIIVQRGNDRYEVTTETLDQLPDDIRPLVENMLNGGNRLNLQGLFAPRPMRSSSDGVVPPRDPNQRIEDRFDGLELKLKELRDAIRSTENDQ